jgi:hypothetical protein
VNMIDRHIEASERLYNMMLQDHKERVSDLVEWADMNASLNAQARRAGQAYSCS